MSHSPKQPPVIVTHPAPPIHLIQSGTLPCLLSMSRPRPCKKWQRALFGLVFVLKPSAQAGGCTDISRHPPSMIHLCSCCNNAEVAPVLSGARQVWPACTCSILPPVQPFNVGIQIRNTVSTLEHEPRLLKVLKVSLDHSHLQTWRHNYLVYSHHHHHHSIGAT